MELSPELILPSHFKIMWYSAINLLPFNLRPTSLTEWGGANVLCNSGTIHARFKFVRLLLVQFWPFLCHERSRVIRERPSLSRHYVAWWKLELDTAMLLASYWAGETVKTTERTCLLFLKYLLTTTSFQGKHCVLFPPDPQSSQRRSQSLSILFYLPTQNWKIMRKTRLFYAGWFINFPRYQGARTIWSESCCFPRELVSFDPRHVTRLLPIRKRIWVRRYNNLGYYIA